MDSNLIIVLFTKVWALKRKRYKNEIFFMLLQILTTLLTKANEMSWDIALFPALIPLTRESGGWFKTKMPSYQYRKSHGGDKMILWPSYLHNVISYTGQMSSLNWIRAQVWLASCHLEGNISLLLPTLGFSSVNPKNPSEGNTHAWADEISSHTTAGFLKDSTSNRQSNIYIYICIFSYINKFDVINITILLTKAANGILWYIQVLLVLKIYV